MQVITDTMPDYVAIEYQKGLPILKAFNPDEGFYILYKKQSIQPVKMIHSEIASNYLLQKKLLTTEV